MNKCNFCECSIPMGTMGAWNCSENVNIIRESKCKKALKTMMEYNEIRSNDNIKKENIDEIK